MNVKCVIERVLNTREGTSQNGVQWKVNELLLGVMCTKKNGEPAKQEIIADCFLDISQKKLDELIKGQLVIIASLWFTTHAYEDRVFQDCRITEMALSLASE